MLDRDKCAPASRSLKEYGALQRSIMLLNLLTGTTIWSAARFMESELATDDSYGSFINSLHAEWWAVPLTFGATIHIVGQVVNGDRRLKQWVTPLWRMIGSVLVTLVMVTFSAGCIYAFNTGTPPELFVLVQTAQSFAFAVLGMWFFGMAYSDLKAGIRNERSRH